MAIATSAITFSQNPIQRQSGGVLKGMPCFSLRKRNYFPEALWGLLSTH